MTVMIWIAGVLPFAVTAALLNFLPEMIPMHFGFDGNVDRWGSKYEMLLVSAIFAVLPVVFQVIRSALAKKEKTSSDEKERAQAKANIKVMSMLGVFTLVFFDIVYGIILAVIFSMSDGNTEFNINGFLKIICILMGILFVVTGNFLPKTKKNGFLGLRTKWSMYNDDTWMKSNRFSGFVMIIVGLLVMVSAVFVSEPYNVLLLIGLLLIGAVVSIIYSFKVYKDELKKGGR